MENGKILTYITNIPCELTYQRYNKDEGVFTRIDSFADDNTYQRAVKFPILITYR